MKNYTVTSTRTKLPVGIEVASLQTTITIPKGVPVIKHRLSLVDEFVPRFDNRRWAANIYSDAQRAYLDEHTPLFTPSQVETVEFVVQDNGELHRNLTNWGWWHFLCEKAHTADEILWDQAAGKARLWPTCACGSLCDLIPRDDDEVGEPIDRILQTWGMEFLRQINTRNIQGAIECFLKIEERATEILNLQVCK